MNRNKIYRLGWRYFHIQQTVIKKKIEKKLISFRFSNFVKLF